MKKEYTDKKAVASPPDHCPNYYKQFFDCSSDAIFIVSSDYHIHDANKAAAELTGFSKAELINYPVQQIFGDETAASLPVCGNSLMEKESRIIKKDGTVLAVDITCNCVDVGETSFIHVVVRNISALKDIKRAYDEKQRFIETLISNIPGVVYRCQNTKDWPITFLNRSNIDLINLICPTNEPFNLTDFIHPDDQAAVWDDVQKAIEANKVFHVTYRLRLPDNNYIWVADHGSAVYAIDGSVLFLEGFITDISKQKKAELQLKTSEEKFRLLFENAQVGMIRFDLKTSITLEANDSAAAIFGYDKGTSLVNVPLREHYYNISLIESLYKTLKKQGFLKNIELPLIKKGETTVWVNVSCWFATDNPGTVNAILLDITDYKHSQEELNLKNDQLVQADKLAALGTLVAGVGHEISNPTSFITMNTPILKEAWEDSLPILEDYAKTHGDFKLAGLNYSEMKHDIPSICTDISNRAKSINKMVMDLKDFSRERPMNLWEKVNINDVLKLALVLTNNTIKKATKNFRLKYGDNVPLLVGNSQRLEQVIINLIVNACQALPNNEKGIFISTSFNNENQQVVLTVKDEGVGISKKNMSLIFDPFFTTKQTRGTGLGLSISYGIIQEHHGTLEIKSELNQGTEAKMILPIQSQG